MAAKQQDRGSRQVERLAVVSSIKGPVAFMMPADVGKVVVHASQIPAYLPITPNYAKEEAGVDSIKVLMATNRPDTLDPAILRPGRLDRKVEFGLPDLESRAQIFRIHTRTMHSQSLTLTKFCFKFVFSQTLANGGFRDSNPDMISADFDRKLTEFRNL